MSEFSIFINGELVVSRIDIDDERVEEVEQIISKYTNDNEVINIDVADVTL